MTCPHCTETIDKDSFYCDQCGEALKICPKCGEPGAKKRCRFDGSVLEFASVLYGSSAAAPVPAPGSVAAPPAPAPPVVPSSPQEAVLLLVNHNLNVQIQPKHGDVLGRVEGPFSHILGQFSAVSGRHAQIQYVQGHGWRIIDLNSTNKTRYNGAEIPPNQPVPIVNGGSLILGQAVEFYTQLQIPASSQIKPVSQNMQNPNTGTTRL